MRFEYLIIDDSEDGNPDSVFELNELGKEGWELCCIQGCGHVIKWYFKRTVENQRI